MRVLIVTNTYPPADIGGVGTLVYELARELAERGHRPRVLTRSAPSAGSALGAADPWVRATGGPKVLFPLTALLAYLRSESEVDLVHLHESDGVLIAAALTVARAFGRAAGRARLVVTLQVSYRRERLAVRTLTDGGAALSRPTAGERLFAWVRAPLLALAGRLSARLADAVVAPSHATAAELAEDYGARVATVIPNGIAPLEPAPAGPAATDAGPVVLYAGRLRTRKAVAVLVAAFARLAAAVPGARLVIAGDGEQRPALAAQVERLGIAERVSFAGAVPRAEMPRLYAAADLFCLPSLYEGFPLAILEAMAAGLPVVATRVAGVPEAVEEGVSGLLVEAADAPALADALAALASDRERRRTFGEAGRRAVEERFSIAAVTAAYLGLWERLVGDRAPDEVAAGYNPPP